jgi:hypothetical protein
MSTMDSTSKTPEQKSKSLKSPEQALKRYQWLWQRLYRINRVDPPIWKARRRSLFRRANEAWAEYLDSVQIQHGEKEKAPDRRTPPGA